MKDRAAGDAPWLDALACPKCSARFTINVEGLSCPTCRRSWPLRNGVPHFIETVRYWGEVPESDALRLLRDAEENGWRAAVLARFGNDRDMRISLLDWQRASWLPLLGLDRDAVALDIGCGYGCITASLARGVKQVFSLEAVTERVELTRLRLAHEKLSNVQLVHASALEAPFAEATFDLVVVNGVLEWVGEWEQAGDPRLVQIQFLRKLARLLKPAGVLLVGIENRLAWDSIAGALDHSGLPYTNLMPRRVATWWLRHRLNQRYRTQLNAAKEYRTYTYSESGYRKLLREGGFESSTFYWGDPGYNEPYHLAPMGRAPVSDRLNEQRTAPWLSVNPGWRAELKALAARLGMLQRFVPDFVIVARRDAPERTPAVWKNLCDAIPGLPDIRNPVFSLTTQPYSGKSVIRVLDADGRKPCCVLKTTTVAPDSAVCFERESEALRIVGEHLKNAKEALFVAPTVIGTTRIGAFRYRAESVARGMPLARTVFREGGPALLDESLPRCLETAVALARILRHEARAGEVDPEWRRVPAGLTAEPKLREQIDSAVRDGETAGWVQHGNFTAEKLFLEAGEAKVTVIDWEHLFRGGSPLFDVFSLLVSMLRLVPAGSKGSDGVSTLWTARFEEAFFGSGEWAGRFRAWLSGACGKLEVADADAWPMFLQFLVFRIHALRERGSWLADEHLRFLETATRKKEGFILLR
jgi:SAM-dependent methyltransferase